MSGSVVDTNVLIRVLRNDGEALRLLGQVEQAFVPVTMMGELFYGAEKSSKKQENMTMFSELLSDYEVLRIDEETALSYAAIKSDLVKKGINIPENDLWIAACASQHNLPLATFDAHFNEIEQIELLRAP